jgi:hypothetical protein
MLIVRREEAKRKAKKNGEHLYDSHYGQQDQYDPNYGPPQQVRGCTFPQKWISTDLTRHGSKSGSTIQRSRPKLRSKPILNFPPSCEYVVLSR